MRQQVNFLLELPEKEVDLFTVDVMLLAFSLFFIFLMVIYGFKYAMNYSLYHEVESLILQEKNLIQENEIINNHLPAATEQASLDEEIKKLQEKVNKQTKSKVVAVVNAKKSVDVSGFSRYLSALSKQIPKEVWLKEIKIQDGGEDIWLLGSALSNNSLARFVKNLSRDDVFKQKTFDIISVNKTKEKNTSIIDFSMGTHLAVVTSS